MRHLRAVLVAMFFQAVGTACGPSMIGGIDANPGDVPDGPPGQIDAPQQPTIDANLGPDANTIIGGYDFGCMNHAPPGTAPDPIALSGTITEGQSMTAASGATVQAHRVSDGTQVGATATSGGGGTFSTSIPTGGAAFDGYILVHLSGELDAYVFPAEPLHANLTTFSDTLLSSSDLSLAASVAGAPSPDSSKGFIGVDIQDCAGHPIQGATVSFTPAPAAVGYTSGGLPSTGASSTDADGIALGFNAPPGQVTVSATFQGVTLHAHVVKSVANALTETIVHP